jgi:chemosensory pili system protein ChpA (sensor histidine kinase/response regulator)
LLKRRELNGTTVATDNNNDFDLGPLSWVQGEIDQALTRGLECLAAFEATGKDVASLKHARNHIHQAAGAIQMVGLDAVVAFTDEVERQLARLEELPTHDAQIACESIGRACKKLRIFLDELVNGAQPVPLKLFPEYESMQRARGVKAASPTDLFYPDLAPRAPRLTTPQVIPAAKLPSYMVKQRRIYQRGLLAWLRGSEEGAKPMRDAVAAIEDATTQPSLRAFWWTVGALLDALVEHGLESGFGVKQLAARVDLQIRRVIEGSGKVADRLRREVLYYVSISAPVAPSVEAVQKGFKLSGLIPSAEVLNADLVRIQPHLREAREALVSAKDAWLKFTSGRAENLPKLKQTLATVHKHVAEVGNGALMKLTASLVERLNKMPQTVTESLAMEYATGMLLAESAIENYAGLTPEFPKQVDTMLARLDAARTARPVSGATAPLLDEMSKRAQERLLLAQVGREIQANLRHMEQVLDAFFRDSTKRSELATLTKDSQQIRGALKMLGLAEAEILLGLCQEQIETYANPEVAVSHDDLELLAESLSGLGFYVEAVEQQRPDRERLIAPLLAKRLGEAPKAVVADRGDTVEAAVDELRSALPALVAEVRRAPADAAARDVLRAKLEDLRNDAELIGDGELTTQAAAALAEFDAGGTASLAAAVTAIAAAGGAAPAPAISEETQRLLATDATDLDAELLEIYLTEAREVLDTVAQQRAVLEGNHGDREALRTVRRQFHTLKGSGRMVGLADLGEIAFGVEKILNRLLEDERVVTPKVLAMIELAERNFREWEDSLSATGRVVADPAPLHATIEAVEAELPPGRESVLTPTPPAPTPELPASLQEAPVASIELPELSAEAPAEWIEMPEASTEASAELIEIRELSGDASAHLMVMPELSEEAPAASPDAYEILPEFSAGDEAAASPESVAHEEAVGAPDDAPSLAMPMIELPEVGSAPHAESSGPVPAVEAPTAPSEAAPALVDAAGPGMVALGEAAANEVTVDEVRLDETAPGEIAPQGIAVAAGEITLGDIAPDEITVGDVTLSAVLFNILVEEALQHLSTLASELEVLQFDAKQKPSPAMVRASHTLCGIHRTGGFPLVATTAKSLEQCLLGLQQREAPLPSVAQPVLARAVAGLRELVGRVRDRVGFAPADVAEAGEIQRELEELRQEATVEPTPADAEALAEHEAARDEHDEARAHGPVAIVTAPTPETAFPDVPPTIAASAVPSEPAVPMHVAPALVAEPEVSFSAPAEDPVLKLRDELDQDVLPIFLEEAGELLPQAGEQLRAWRRRPSDHESASQLRRTLHTFKGSARMAGAMRLGELTHQMESRLDTSEGAAEGTPALFDALDDDLDRVAFVFETLREGKANVALPWIVPSEPAPAAADVENDASPEPPPVPAPATAQEPAPTAVAKPIIVPLPLPLPSAAPTTTAHSIAAAAVAPAPEVETGQRAQLRVRADMIDRLVNEAGEVAIARARVEGELRSLKSNLLELTGSVIRLRSQVREIEIQGESQIQSRMSLVTEDAEGFDPLEFDRYTRFQELTRSLAEGVNDVSTVQQSLLKNLDDADAALVAQARLSRDVQQQLFSIRTVPFGSLSERLYRILRTTAKELDKRANLEIRGGQTELDRSVLEKLVGPLEHLLRNALDHGLEPRSARAAAGKPETGEIALTVRQVGNEIAIELTDDGAGINLEQVRVKAVAQGRLAADVPATDAQLIEFIFQAGFSTASQVTQVSGRGIGMDVVRTDIAALGGRVEVTTKPGHGTAFLLYLPLTLAVAQAVLVKAGGRLWALPAPMVEQVQQVKADALVNLYVERRVEWHGKSYPFHYLPRLLGDPNHNPETGRYNPVILLRAGQNLAAVHVDEMIGHQEVVVKNIGPQLARVSGIAGATVLGSGEIVLIINPVQLAQRPDVQVFNPNEERLAPSMPRMGAADAGVASPLVMIVDDSLTVRKITSRTLTRAGFQVITAKDGIDALELLDDRTPDVILLDIEMPRMDGFEFTKTIKADPATAHIPIIMITSRTAEKHRNRAQELGVDLYLGKPYQEEELLRNLREMLAFTA